MARIAGIKTIKDSRGAVTHITIDIRKHPQAINTLKRLGLIEKTQFEKNCENALPADEVFKKVHEFIDGLEWKK